MSVLAVGAHPDDIEIGCAGALCAHVAAGQDVYMLVMTDGQRGPGGLALGPTRRAEQEAAAAVLGVKVLWGGLVDCDVQVDRSTVDIVEQFVSELAPTTVYAPWPKDSHQDHRAVSAAATSAARRVPRVLYYPGPTSLDFTPSLYVPIEGFLPAKIASIQAHATQVAAAPLVDPDVVAASALHYGQMARTKYAEAFAPLRFSWDVA